MGENSKISWTDHTFNPWIGCTKVSPGCANCYAETLMDTRYGRVKWGKGQLRSRTSESNWKQPLAWNRAAAPYSVEIGKWITPPRPRVFCASLADWLDPEVPVAWRADLLRLIRRTPNLDWLLLTKRPQLWKALLDDVCCYLPPADPDVYPDSPRTLQDWIIDWYNDQPPANVWIGTTVENQERANERIPHLLKIPARVRFISCEPLLGPVVLPEAALTSCKGCGNNGSMAFDYKPGSHPRLCADACSKRGDPACIHWVICGGESGPKARPMHPDWARSLRDQCAAVSVPFFFKQWGEWMPRSQLFLRCNEPAAVQLAKHLKMQSAVMRRDSGIDASLGDACTSNDADSAIYRVGTKAAGHLLDGKEHQEFPEVLP